MSTNQVMLLEVEKDKEKDMEIWVKVGVKLHHSDIRHPTSMITQGMDHNTEHSSMEEKKE